MIHAFIKQFVAERILPDFVRIRNAFFIIPSEHQKIISNISLPPVFVGTCLGYEHENRFKPSVYLLQLLSNNSPKKIVLDKQGEWLYICGRDIPRKNIIEHPLTLSAGDSVLIENQHQECLGYGKITAPRTSTRSILKNIFDIGDFLRRERRYR